MSYRPLLSISCNVSKFLKRIICDKIKILFPFISYLYSKFDAVMSKLNLQLLLIFMTETAVIYLDIAKTFDNTPHNKLFMKHHFMETIGSVVLCHLHYQLLWDSILGPLQFIINMAWSAIGILIVYQIRKCLIFSYFMILSTFKRRTIWHSSLLCCFFSKPHTSEESKRITIKMSSWLSKFNAKQQNSQIKTIFCYRLLCLWNYLPY